MGVAVNKAGEEEHSGAVHHLGASGGEIRADGGHQAVFQAHVRRGFALGGNDDSAFQQGSHRSVPPL